MELAVALAFSCGSVYVTRIYRFSKNVARFMDSTSTLSASQGLHRELIGSFKLFIECSRMRFDLGAHLDEYVCTELRTAAIIEQSTCLLHLRQAFCSALRIVCGLVPG
jgi:hypothetical protein